MATIAVVAPGVSSTLAAGDADGKTPLDPAAPKFRNQTPSIVADRSFEVPETPGVRFHDLVSVSLGGVGTIANVISSTGGTANAASQQRYVVSYP